MEKLTFTVEVEVEKYEPDPVNKTMFRILDTMDENFTYVKDGRALNNAKLTIRLDQEDGKARENYIKVETFMRPMRYHWEDLDHEENEVV